MSQNDTARAKPSKGVAIGFVQGLFYVIRGARYVYFQHPKLARYWLAPIVLSAMTIGASAWAGWTYSDAIVDLVWRMPTGEGWLDSFLRGLHHIVEFFVSIAIWMTSLFLVIGLSSILAAPFNDALSEAIEHIETGAGSGTFSLREVLSDTGRTVYLELSKLVLLAGVLGPLLCCSLTVPGFGQVAYSVVGFGCTATFLAMDYIDWPAGRRRKDGKYRWRFVRTYFGASIGFGTGVFLLLFVPGLNLFFMPAAVAGGTLLFLDIEGPRRDVSS